MRLFTLFASAVLLTACTASPDRSLAEAARFWDAADFTDPAFAARPEAAEAHFADYIRLLKRPGLDAVQTGPLLRQVLDRAAADPQTFRLFGELCEKYLYSPESPLRDDELYLHALDALIGSPHLDDYEKLRPRYQRNMALRNRIGEPAADFTCTLADGSRTTLYAVEAEYTLLLFSDPGCEACSEMIRSLQRNRTLARAERNGRLRVVALYSHPEERTDRWRAHLGDYPAAWIAACDDGARIHYEGLYDLRSIPCLYLLDARKRVVVKGALAVEPVAEALRKGIRTTESSENKPPVQ